MCEQKKCVQLFNKCSQILYIGLNFFLEDISSFKWATHIILTILLCNYSLKCWPIQVIWSMNNFFSSETGVFEIWVVYTNVLAPLPRTNPRNLSSIGFTQVYYFLERVGTLDDLQGFSEKGRVLCIFSPSIMIRASELKTWIWAPCDCRLRIAQGAALLH